MHIKEKTLGSLSCRLIAQLVKSPIKTNLAKGPARELFAALLSLHNPRFRYHLSANSPPFLALIGELIWIINGSNELAHIEYYIPNYSASAGRSKYINGAYGPRIFGTGKNNQFTAVAELLKGNSGTQQAVIQIFGSSDLVKGSQDVPRACTIQFVTRAAKLHALVNVRSSDILQELPRDIFIFTMLQEIMARAVGCEVGSYSHMVGSLHLYEHDLAKARDLLEAGDHRPTAMPLMPAGDPWPSILWLRNIERALRLGGQEIGDTADVDPYWVDIARLLRIKKFEDAQEPEKVAHERKLLSFSPYKSFVRPESSLTSPDDMSRQPSLPGLMSQKRSIAD